MTRARKQPSAVDLAIDQLRKALTEGQPAPANDGEPTPDEVEEIRALARLDAEEMRRARRR